MESEKEFEGERKKTFREVFGTNARRAGANRNKRNEEKGKMKPYWMGLDIGGTKCAVLLATVDGGIHLKDKLRFETQSERGFEPVYAQLTETMDEILRKNGLTYADLNAVGVSCGGPLDSRRGVVLCPPNLPGWVNIPLKAMLEERCGVPVYLQNDANACALVEWKIGRGQRMQRYDLPDHGHRYGRRHYRRGKTPSGLHGYGRRDWPSAAGKGRPGGLWQGGLL